MLFNSLDFMLFLPAVFFLYWLIVYKKPSLQNIFLVAASYVFYGWWDWRFLFLIMFSSAVDYCVGAGLAKTGSVMKRKILLWTSIVINLSLLGFFKYSGFFVDSFIRAFTFLGMPLEARSFHFVLPVGISFYTFQTMSYSIDVYKKKIEPAKDFIAFAAFVSFFPQLVAGPIERASHLLPQFFGRKCFQYQSAVDGLRQILWGFFKKIAIADVCAPYANMIFNNYGEYNGAALIAGALFFTLQIYGDFSGYSDIAIGTARLFGFELSRNFAFPFFSRNIGEFWRRWHISLNTWFRDYVYIPLGGNRRGRAIAVRNTAVVFLLSGLWHGASLHFIAWGAVHALFFLPLLLTGQNRKYLDAAAHGRILPRAREFFAMFWTFCITVFAWIFFRADGVRHALRYIGGIFTGPFFSPVPFPVSAFFIFKLSLIALFFTAEWLGREKEHPLARLPWRKPLRRLCYYGILGCVFLFSGTPQSFVYFQF